ncbi:MAG: spermidine synthase [Bradymonadia bacterium]|jgi:spermidine synthase
MAESPTAAEHGLSNKQLAVLQASVLVVALCGIAYELIIATVSSYLLGNSVYQFSITIGLFMFAMGIGSYLTKRIETNLVTRFIKIEIAVAVIGGLSSTILFMVYPYRAFYTPVMYTQIIIIGTLVGLEIPILTRILSRREELKESIAHVLSLDYLGALIGSVGFPLLLLPHLGLFRSSFAIGLLNFAVGMLNVVVFWNVLKNARRYMIVCLVGIGVLTAGMIWGSAVTAYAEGRLFASTIIYRQQTPYQRIIVVRDDLSGKVRLFLDGHLQFAETDEHRYHEALVHPVLSLPGTRENVLILGGGDGMAAREIFKYPDVQRVDLVDIDPAMTELCREFPPILRLNKGSLDDARVTVHNTDAFNWVKEHQGTYDRIIIDLPDPHNESLSKLYSKEFYKMVKRSLRDGGYFVTQSTSPFFTREAFRSIGVTVEAAEMSVYQYHVTVPTFNVWGFTLAAKSGPVPTQFDITVPTRFVTNEVMVAAGIFAPDTQTSIAQVNSVFEPTMYEMYLKGMYR